MSSVRQYLVYGVDDVHKHRWPVHYHLLKGDYLAAIDSIRQGANVIDTKKGRASALSLCYELFFKTLNKCFNSTQPLGNVPVRPSGLSAPSPNPHLVFTQDHCSKVPVQKRKDSKPTIELHGMADYNLPSIPPKGCDEGTVDQLSCTKYFESAIAYHQLDTASSMQHKLVRRLRGLLVVLKTMAERNDMLLHCKQGLLRAVKQLEYPQLYTSVMDYMFKNAGKYGMGHVDVDNVWDARRVWRTASSKDPKLQSLANFISQIAKVLEELCSVFHVNIYNKAQETTGAICSGHDRHLRLPGMEISTVEILAHMAFVNDCALLFDTMVLQEPFLQGSETFKWSDLLSHLLTANSSMKAYIEPLMRRSLRNNVEYRIRSPSVAYKNVAQ
ncbi:hypothetical protein BaOVIS_011040 [Babesia ovis]|uniref:Uncharacterized protein n=1 Tax=Babesia ovis TaxID=5869 RepID=A0A9W5WU82_BABOV|nr:hypothetical protein BaOVIS_011040 [Babesia ovis]